MIAVVATLRAKEGQAEEFERLFLDMAKQVRANEPGNVVYQLCRSRTEPNTYRVLELYRDDAAVEAHRASDHFRSSGAALGQVLAGRPEIEMLDALG